MRNKKELAQNPMGRALIELDQIMTERDYPEYELNIVGGFAMIMHGYRDITNKTDVDYVGYELPFEIALLSESLKRKYALDEGWLNNDLMLPGITLEDFELSTGKLHFNNLCKLNKLTINIIDEKDLLRLKLIALDTALTAVELGGDFSRMKDLADTLVLIKGIKTDIKTAIKDNKEYLINNHLEEVLNIFEKDGSKAVSDYITDTISDNIINIKRTRVERHKRSQLIDNMLTQAFERAAKEDY